jgi:hypothetical protein
MPKTAPFDAADYLKTAAARAEYITALQIKLSARPARAKSAKRVAAKRAPTR